MTEFPDLWNWMFQLPTWAWVVGVIAIVFVCFRWSSERSTRKYRKRELVTQIDDIAFEQAGIRVTYSTKRIRLPSGKEHPVSSVRSIRYETFRAVSQDHFNVIIQIDDLENPIYVAEFTRLYNVLEFVPRLQLALETAGSTKFRAVSSEHVEVVNQHHINHRHIVEPTVVDEGKVIDLRPIERDTA